MTTIQNAISRFIDNGDEFQLQSACDKTSGTILRDIRSGINFEAGEDEIDSEAFRYGQEIAENYTQHQIWKILEIVGE